MGRKQFNMKCMKTEKKVLKDSEHTLENKNKMVEINLSISE